MKIVIGDDHSVEQDKKDIGRELENKVEKFIMEIPNNLAGYDCYLEFSMPDENKYMSDILVVENLITNYTIPIQLLSRKGYVKCQLVAKKDDIIWKSDIWMLSVSSSINAVQTLPEQNQSWFADLKTILQDAQNATNEALKSADTLNKLYISALNPPSPLKAAKGDGLSDDSQAIQALYNYIRDNGGDTLFLPRGTYLCNIVLSGANVNVEGSGPNATVLKPYNLTNPIIKIGDTTTLTRYLKLTDLLIRGDSLTTTSDGIVIDGANKIIINSVEINSFGRNNIHIRSTGIQPTMYLHFDNIRTISARTSCLKINYGSKWVTAIYFNDAEIESYDSTTASAIDMASTGSNQLILNLLNSWVQVAGSKRGHIILNDSNCIINAYNVMVDSNGSSDTLLYRNTVGDLLTVFLRGSINLDGKIEFNDGTTTTDTGGLNAPYRSIFSYPIIENSLYISDTNKTASEKDSANGSNCMVVNNAGGLLRVYRNGTSGEYGFIPVFEPSYAPNVPPTNSSSVGARGTIMVDENYLYFAVSTNSWKRIPLSSF